MDPEELNEQRRVPPDLHVHRDRPAQGLERDLVEDREQDSAHVAEHDGARSEHQGHAEPLEERDPVLVDDGEIEIGEKLPVDRRIAERGESEQRPVAEEALRCAGTPQPTPGARHHRSPGCARRATGVRSRVCGARAGTRFRGSRLSRTRCRTTSPTAWRSSPPECGARARCSASAGSDTRRG